MNDTPVSPAPPTVSERDQLAIIIGVLLAMLLAALDQTIVAPAIPIIGAALGGGHYISWIVSAYFLTATATTPLYGKIADIYGRRGTLYTAMAIFVVGSVICALSPNMAMLIIGRAVQGLGGGGLMALAQTVIGDLVPPRERGRFAIYISATWATASIAGPLLGGFITQHLSWPLIFWLNLPLAAFAVWMTSETLKRLPWVKRQHRLDIVGSVLVVAGTSALMLALALGPQPQFGWLSQSVVGLFTAAAAIAAIFAWHTRRAAEPLIPLDVLSDKVVLAATFSVFFAMAAFIGLSVFVPIYLELVLGLSASGAGLALLPYMVGTVIGANYAGRASARVEHYKRLPLLGLGAGCLGLLWCAWRAASMGLWETEILLGAIGVGSGMQFPITVVSVQNAVDPSHMGVATAVLAFLRALGSSIGVAAMGAVGAASGVGVTLAEEGAKAGGAVALSGANFAPVFLAGAVSLGLGFTTLSMMEERPLRGRAATRPAEVEA